MSFKKFNYLDFKESSKKKKISYFELLDRIICLLKTNPSNIYLNQKLVICPPKVKRDGPKKTVFVNFDET